jgi:signal transduction histidine kinase
MLRVIGCITDQHDLRLVLLAGLICLFASYTAIDLLGRAGTEKRQRQIWIAAAAFVTGTGIWATHFVAQLAFRPGMAAGYDLAPLVLSAALAVVISWIALVTASMRSSLAGGTVLGLAIGAMHYTGAEALSLPATARWDWDYVAASVVIGIVASVTCLALASRASGTLRRIGAALALVLAICGLHFTGMAAVTYSYDPLIVAPAQILAPDILAIVVAIVALLIVALGFVSSAMDHQMAERATRDAEELRKSVRELETTQRELQSTAAQLRVALDAASAGNRAKEQFLATMSHELRTPLNAIIGFAEIMKSELFGPLGAERYRVYSQDIHRSGAHLLSLINDVLDITKIDAGRLELRDDRVVLADLVSECVGMTERFAATRSITLHAEIAAVTCTLRVDQRRLRQILLNLLSNAVKFTEDGGAVRIRSWGGSDGLFIAVVDTGIGMAPGDIPRALERFGQIDSRLSRKYEGTGLGLPLSKHLVELHGGTLSLESALGKGTTITIRLPQERVLEFKAAA